MSSAESSIALSLSVGSVVTSGGGGGRKAGAANSCSGTQLRRGESVRWLGAPPITRAFKAITHAQSAGLGRFAGEATFSLPPVRHLHKISRESITAFVP